MKNSIYLVMVLFVALSCKLTDKKADEDVLPQAESKEVMKAVDKDENGCLASAGYIWSKLNKECVKLFTGVQLNPIDKPQNEDETVSAFIMFSEDGSQAELFLPNSTETYILTRKTEGESWVLNEWQLIPYKGYILKQGEKILYAGDDFIGKKVLGTDIEEK
ncbi:MAG: hypothetical protein R2805_07685 [Flavobacterium sp.]|jgi:hypothetical protein